MTPAKHLEAWMLVALMGLGSVVMWLVGPVFWLWFASHVVSTNAPTMGGYMLVLAGVVATALVVGKLLGVADRRWARVTGAYDERRHERSWNKSLRGDRGPVRRETILDRVMLISVSVALTLFGVWFFVFAGSSLPGS